MKLFIAVPSLLVFLFLSGCAPIRFTCGVGEFGPRAKLAAYGVSPEDVEVLAHLCGGDVDET